MRIAIATVQVPFITGGAEYHARGLLDALRAHGHTVDLVSLPFWFNRQHVAGAIDAWRALDFATFDAGSPDGVIALRFPSYNLVHPNKTVWLLHQHRSVYDLLDTPLGEDSTDPRTIALKNRVAETDHAALSAIRHRFANSRTVSERLRKYNDLSSEPLYHPPPGARDYVRNGPIFPYIFAPSRLEELKRQDLLIRAVPHIDPAISVIISGTGGMGGQYRRLAADLGVEDRVKFVGHISEDQKRRYYHNALAVFFGPYEEDLGYITLEAMLSTKPVVTCHDSGGPSEFVVDGETGYVCDPEPDVVAEKINALWKNPGRAKEMGVAGWERYQALNISWDNVVSTLVGALA